MKDLSLLNPDYQTVSSEDLLAFMGVDAHKWAQAFMSKNEVIDEFYMLRWFSNAIEAGKNYKRHL